MQTYRAIYGITTQLQFRHDSTMTQIYFRVQSPWNAMKRHRFLVCFETYLTPIMQFVRNISSILQTWQNDRIWRLFVFWFHQESFTTICDLSWMPTTQSILSSRLWSLPPCRLRPPVLSDHICLAHWVVVIYRFYCIINHAWIVTINSICLSCFETTKEIPILSSVRNKLMF